MKTLRLLLRSLLALALMGGVDLLCWADTLSEGISLYKIHNYPQAMQKIQLGLKANPTASGVFYLGMCYVRLNRLDEARDAFDHVLQMAPPNSELAVLARNNINYVTKQQITMASSSTKAAQVLTTSLSRTSKDNYLTYVLFHGKVVHFATDHMPLKVFITEGRGVQGWDSSMKQSVLSAMRIWQQGTRNRVSFTQVYSQSNADIVVRWRRNFSDGILGVSPLQTVGDTIVASDVNLATFYPDSNRAIPPDDLRAIAVHELGHAIGIRGHSPNPDDIMFYSKTRQEDGLSQRDMNTVGMLYNLQADVQNGNSSTAQNRQYYDLYQQGFQAQTSGRNDTAMAAYRQAIQINPNKFEARFNLGALLINEGNQLVRNHQLEQARNHFAEARQLFDNILQMPHPPQGTQENLTAAETNYNLVNNALTK